MKRQLVITNDGSHSLFVPKINECYHSIHGSIVEAEHIFIRNGLLAANKKKMNILEVGFGTGLNTLLTGEQASNKNINIDYHAVELYPLKDKEYTQLNFTELIGVEKNNLLKIHKAEWEVKNRINNNLTLTKYQISIEEYITDISFDIIYFDAFSPDKEERLWTESIFKKMFLFLKDDGFLVTYCAKGVVRRILKKAGFEVISLDGPPGKRQMTRANRK